MNADEMFKKLGYKMFEGLRTIDYDNKYGHFQFQKSNKENRKVFIVKDEMTDYITMQELQAINKKCQELGWLEEERC